MAGPWDDRDRLVERQREVLIEARKTAGFNQTQLGKALGKSQSFVSNYERGQRRLDMVDFILIARVLGVEPGELLRRLG
ncbi:MAG TPA: helix-turn-helix transcriptional regulator [Allosphingosinicella sp.]|nr:helix-turn-helix transcriptional regulator [Allosphingosinicella sp.]